MAHYAIGDLQGCLAPFQALLAEIGFNPGSDTLWLTGDLVNRGPQSLATLRFVRRHEHCMQTVLGNHDLNLIAIAHGYGRLKKSDTVTDILNAPDRLTLIDWLRLQPLLIRNEQQLLVHAGLWPDWDADTAAARCAEVEAALRHRRPQAFLAHMYGNTPLTDTAGSEAERLRFTTNVCTRMRALTRSGALDFDYKSTLAEMPATLQPWFRAPNRRQRSHRIVFGHWSALGLYQGDGVTGLDTGALWGGQLTAIELGSGRITQVAGLPGGDWRRNGD